ncbi:MAG: PqqD family protein [Oscillospiraceae bacterium]|nr:PqqD family protein [Oscillospiraceae bacterium]
MKLKTEFITQKTGQNYVAVTAQGDNDVLNGMVRNNETADFIFRQLMEETTEEQIVAALLAEYDVPEDVAARDVHKVIEIYRDEGLLDD